MPATEQYKGRYQEIEALVVWILEFPVLEKLEF